MDGRYPIPRGHHRSMTQNNRTSMLTSHISHIESTMPPHAETNQSLARSKSDMDMSRLLRMPSSSQLSYNPPSSRSEYFPSMKDEKQSSMRSLISKSSRLLHKGRTSTKLRSWDSAERPNISEPYNFRHLTHTGPAQAKALKTSNPNQLVTEFSVIRASQAPKSELKGIKAEDIVSPSSVDAYSPLTTRAPSPPQSPKTVTNAHHLRSIKSVDSFTRLKSNSFSSPIPPIIPPPRRSSRQIKTHSQGLALANIDTAFQSDPANTSPKSYYGAKFASSEETLEPCEEIAQAVTTPDNSAQLFITHQRNVSSAGLPNVPEEEELERTEARIRELQHKLRHAKSFPDRSAFNMPIDRTRILAPRSPRKLYTSPSQNSWEDDVDYCYQHAMDAVDFAWDAEASWEYDPNESTTNPYLGSFFISSTGIANTDSATSSAISVPGIITPTEPVLMHDSFPTSSHPFLFPVATAPLPQKEFPTSFPIDNHFQHPQAMDPDTIKIEPSFFAPSAAHPNDAASSPRTSGGTGTMSKYSSHESLNTRTPSVFTGSGFSKHCRSSSSIGSVPDMLPYGMSTSSSAENMAHKFNTASANPIITNAAITATPLPPRPATAHPSISATRTRAASESAGRLLDLDMIGAPAPLLAGGRSRAGSVASARAPALARPNYNLFPTPALTR